MSPTFACAHANEHQKFTANLTQWLADAAAEPNSPGPISLQIELFRAELEEVVNTAIKELPDDLRAAVTLREFDGLSYEDIADIMDCPVGTVRSRIFRARVAIDTRVQAQLVGRDPYKDRGGQTNG